MLGKLLKYDFRKNMRWLWILFVGAIVAAGITRGLVELGKSIAFFKVLSILFDSVFYALVANSLIQPFLRGFMDFSKSLYGDESYLTHTLPVTKKQIINSKYITTFAELLMGFASVIIAILIRFASPTFLQTIKYMLSAVVTGEFSALLALVLMIVLVIVEFLMFSSIINFSIVMAYKSNEKKVLKSFLFTAAFAAIAMTVLSVAMVIMFVAFGVDISSSTLTFTAPVFFGIIITGIVVYLLFTVLFYFLAKKEFGKGVNVD